MTGVGVMIEFFVTFTIAPFLMKFVSENTTNIKFIKNISENLLSIRKIGGIILIGVLFISLFFIKSLNFNTEIIDFFPLKTELRKNHEEIKESFNSLFGLEIILEKRGNSKSKIGVKQLTINLDNELSRLPGIKTVDSYKDLKVLQQKYVVSPFQSSFHEPMSLYINNNQSRIHISVKNPDNIQNLKLKIDAITNKYSEDFEISFFSSALLFNDINDRVAKSLLKSLLFSGIIILLLFFVITKSIRNTLVSILANMVPLGGLVLMFALFKIDLNIGTAITLIICLGLIVDDTIHILYRKLLLKENLNELKYSLFITTFLLATCFMLFNKSNFLPTKIFGSLSAAVFIITYVSDLIILNWLLRINKKSK